MPVSSRTEELLLLCCIQPPPPPPALSGGGGGGGGKRKNPLASDVSGKMLTLFGHPPLPPHPSPLTLAKSPAFSAAAKTEVRGYKGDPEQQQEKVDNVIFKKRILQRKT